MYLLTKKLTLRSVQYSDKLNVLYLKNRKVACSTIQYSLWMALDRLNRTETFTGVVHTRDTPFVKDIFATNTYNAHALRQAVVFSAVRNPFVRILSAYLNKVGKDMDVWEPFRKRYGIKPNVTQAELTFPDFLRIVASEPDEILDAHFCPQYINLLLPYAKLTFVGRLEAVDELAAFMEGIGAPIKEGYRNASHSTRSLTSYYDEDSLAIVREKYAKDFKLFGYSTELGDLNDFDRNVYSGDGKDYLVDYILTGETQMEFSTPAEKAYLKFSTAPINQKIGYIRNNFAEEGNWDRLHQFASIALKQTQFKLARDVIDRTMMLRARHKKMVKNKDIFT